MVTAALAPELVPALLVPVALRRGPAAQALRDPAAPVVPAGILVAVAQGGMAVAPVAADVAPEAAHMVVAMALAHPRPLVQPPSLSSRAARWRFLRR
jgi:hypothetical protein